MKNIIKLKSGYEIVYDDFELDTDGSRLRLICQIDKGSNRDYFNDCQKKQLVENDPFDLEYDGKKYSGIIVGAGMRFNGDFRTSTIYITFNVELNVVAHDCIHDAKIMYVIPCELDSDICFREFIAPIDKKFHSRECSVFTVDNRTWRLKKAYRRGNGYASCDMLASMPIQEAVGYILETDAEDNEDIEALSKQATHICHLFGFAGGRILMWKSVWVVDGMMISLLKLGNNISSQSNRAKPSVCCHDARVRYYDPVDFIEQAWQEYYRDPAWWRVTMLWFSYRWNSDAIEVQKLIEGILLDRVCRKLIVTVVETCSGVGVPLEESFRKIAEKRLKNYFDPAKTAPITSSTDATAFNQLIDKWVNGPRYVEYISSTIEYAGGSVPQQDKDDLELRNGFAHNGEASKPIVDIFSYDGTISKYCIAIIMGMLGYKGVFRTNFSNFDVGSVLPNYDRLKLSTIHQLAQQYAARP